MNYNITMHAQIGFYHQLHQVHKITCAKWLSITLSAVFYLEFEIWKEIADKVLAKIPKTCAAMKPVMNYY